MSRSRGLLGLCLRWVAICGLAWWAASNALAALTADPVAAARFSPLRTDLRISAALHAFNGQAGQDLTKSAALSDLAGFIAQTRYLAPGDASAVSLAALAASAQGHNREAQELFAQASRRAPTERAALDHRLQAALAHGNAEAALDCLDLALRRFPGSDAASFAILAQMARTEPTRTAMFRRLASGPAWRGRFMRASARVATSIPNGLDIAEAFLLWQLGQGIAADPDERNRVINGLIGSRLYKRAKRLHLLTLGETQRSMAGLLHDRSFRTGFSGNRLGWSHLPNSDAFVDMTAETGLTIRFRERPARLGNVHQVLVLPPGEYHLEVQASATALHAPRPLVWTLVCMDTWQVLARLDVPGGSYGERLLEASFAVPPSCSAQQLTLLTEQRVQSYNQGYSGRVTFRTMNLETATVNAVSQPQRSTP